MSNSTRPSRKLTIFVTALLGGLILSSCASSHAPSSQAPSGHKALDQGELVPYKPQQLIKNATLTMIVNSVDQSVSTVMQIMDRQQGDLIGLDEEQPTRDDARQTATIQLRVPQNLLQSTLDQLAKLGTVENWNITVEDVGDRLVDFSARLTNLKKTEASLQKIMDRAGSVSDVLNVSQKLSEVRESIEEINAQLQNLKNQVAYSTITLNLEAAMSSSPQPSIGSQIQETWQDSTHSFSRFTIGLLKFSIWLMVYSPYLLIVAVAVCGFRRWRKTH